MDKHGPRGTVEFLCWNAARDLKSFTHWALAERAGVSYYSVSATVNGWVKEGRAQVVGRDADNRKRFRISDPEKAPVFPTRPDGTATRAQSKHGNMWTVIRRLKLFQPLDISAHATTDKVEVSEEDARSYCQQLVLAGYLKVERKARHGLRPAVYRLVRNTGPYAPRERRVRAIYDDNEDRFTYVAGLPGEVLS